MTNIRPLFDLWCPLTFHWGNKFSFLPPSHRTPGRQNFQASRMCFMQSVISGTPNSKSFWPVGPINYRQQRVLTWSTETELLLLMSKSSGFLLIQLNSSMRGWNFFPVNRPSIYRWLIWCASEYLSVVATSLAPSLSQTGQSHILCCMKIWLDIHSDLQHCLGSPGELPCQKKGLSYLVGWEGCGCEEHSQVLQFFIPDSLLHCWDVQHSVQAVCPFRPPWSSTRCWFGVHCLSPRQAAVKPRLSKNTKVDGALKQFLKLSLFLLVKAFLRSQLLTVDVHGFFLLVKEDD